MPRPGLPPLPLPPLPYIPGCGAGCCGSRPWPCAYAARPLSLCWRQGMRSRVACSSPAGPSCSSATAMPVWSASGRRAMTEPQGSTTGEGEEGRGRRGREEREGGEGGESVSEREGE